MNDEEDLHAVAIKIVELCATEGLVASQAISCLAGAIGLTVALTGSPWSDGLWPPIQKLARQIYDGEMEPDPDESKH